MRDLLEDFEARQATSLPLSHLWRRGQALIGRDDPADREVARTVLANALALIHFDEPADLTRTAMLADELGCERLATLQEEVLAPIDLAPRRPRTTALVARVSLAAWAPDPHRAAGPERDALAELVSWLLQIGDEDGPAPVLRTRAQVVAATTDGDLLTWRRLARAVAERPWVGPVGEWLALLDPVEDALLIVCLTAHREWAQRDAERREREDVAQHIRRMIAESGVTQREFARLVGTSQPRLSTYASGAVVPSATMLVRIIQTSERLRRRG
ncbi:helix-turn-helix transcriptional regulator [Nocardioides albidus]|uniref:Helix-turn-helix transcriptional regulator n=1 Tax=Nocardioides albidus TaxID=1517589 RepID=A0A5C4VPF7_9ACTN|nr:helix-turn-helix transcriptional regulator [Nocardioides albidus]TNM37396.1 helix-turn-helix transcriptional regulator [Nocardioides albidus]